VRNGPRRTPGRLRAVVYAVLVHAAVITALVIGFRWSHSPPAAVPGKPIDAVVVEDEQKKKLEEAHRKAEEQKRRAEEARQQTEAEKKRQEEVQRQQAEAEKQRQAELKRKQDAEQRRKQEEEAQRAEEQKRRENEARKKAEAEKQRLAEEARKRTEAEQQRKAAEEQLKQQLAAEEQARIEAARAARAATEAEKYKAIIRQKVSRNWNRPPGAPPGLHCTVHVRLAAGGEVLQATVVQSSGNPLFDRSVEAAVQKASPLPIPQDPDLLEYFREIEFVFTPEG
jgi:colicin import membrane protein